MKCEVLKEYLKYLLPLLHLLPGKEKKKKKVTLI